MDRGEVVVSCIEFLILFYSLSLSLLISLVRFSKLVETISKNPIPPHVRALVVEICVTDKDDNDVKGDDQRVNLILCFPNILNLSPLLTLLSPFSPKSRMSVLL